MRVAYFQCVAGVSGDMLVASLLDAGADLEGLRRDIACLGLPGVRLSREEVLRAGFRATRFCLEWDDSAQGFHSYGDIEKLLRTSPLSPSVQEKSLRVFQRLADAEARVHGMSREAVHFHELGAVDTLIDVVGTMLALEQLGVERIVSSPINVGSGSVSSAHGTLPLPAPGTAALLEGVSVFSEGPQAELTTPTGAALLTTLAEGFSSMPAIRLERVGYGAGSRDHPGFPNVLRVFLGSSELASETDVVIEIEANIDDLNPEFFDYVMERLFDAGALDVFVTPVLMKKGRPAQLLSLLAPPEQVDGIVDTLFRETSTFGVRLKTAERRKLDRDWLRVETPLGPVRVKVGRRGGEVLQLAPEYEDCRRIARERKVPLREVYEAARREAHRLVRGSGPSIP